MTARQIIVAVATPQGRGGIGIVRLSGTGLAEFAKKISDVDPKPRMAMRASFRASDNSIIDQGLLLFFPQPNSYTGEDVLELQGHGGIAVMQTLLWRCLELGAKLAEPGEFTHRAFLNGKLDLAQAEAVADLIDAQSQAQARAAMRSLDGEFSKEITLLLAKITELRMQLEAYISFPEEDISPLRDFHSPYVEIIKSITAIQARAKQGSLLRTGVVVTITGQPNVGKSSLFNRLAGVDHAIVTDIPGTTRDLLHETILLAGVPFHFIDTAGLRESTDPIEQIGMERTRNALAKSDITLLIVDARMGLTAADQELMKHLPQGDNCVIVYNKSDLNQTSAMASPQLQKEEVIQSKLSTRLSSPIVAKNQLAISALTGQGIPELCSLLLEQVGAQADMSENTYFARERHLLAIEEALTYLLRAGEQEAAIELFADELRLAHDALGKITSKITADELLGHIFSRFCIGK